MYLFSNGACQRESRPDGNEAEDGLEENIAKRREDLVPLEELEGFVTERRERRVAAQNADHEQQTCIGREEFAGEEAAEDADQEAA